MAASKCILVVAHILVCFLPRSQTAESTVVHDSCECIFSKTNDTNTLYRSGQCSSTCSEINLSGQGIVSLDPNVFQDLSGVSVLNLTSNRIFEIVPEIFSSCRNLSSLDLSHNEIQSFTVNAFFGLSNLVLLDLSHNLLTEIPEPTCNIGEYEECTQLCCELGLTCFVANPYYAQCRHSCPSDWDCSVLQPGEILEPPAPTPEIQINCSDYGFGDDCTDAGCCQEGYSCYRQNSVYSQCFATGDCPGGWECNESGEEMSGTTCPLVVESQCTPMDEECPCDEFLECVQKDDYYAQCLPKNYCPVGWMCTPSANPANCSLSLWEDCTDEKDGCCKPSLHCYAKERGYAQCRPENDCPDGWDCAMSKTESEVAPSNCSLATFSECTTALGNGTDCCEDGSVCYYQDAYFGQCLPVGQCPDNWECSLPSNATCTLAGYDACTNASKGCCRDGFTCQAKDDSYSQCLPTGECPRGWACDDGNYTCPKLGLWDSCHEFYEDGCECEDDLVCSWKDHSYAQCRPPDECPEEWPCSKDMVPIPVCFLTEGASCSDSGCCGVGLECYHKNESYSECKPEGKCPPGWNCPDIWGDACDLGEWATCTNVYKGCCQAGLLCYRQGDYYAQCLKPGTCPDAWDCGVTSLDNPALASDAVFGSLSSLKTLRLHMNQIGALHSNAFKGLAQLTTLDLSNNMIEDIHVKAFSGLWRLDWLDLSVNKIESMTWEIMAQLVSVRYLALFDNEFNCLPVLPGSVRFGGISLTQASSITGCLPEQCSQHVRNQLAGFAQGRVPAFAEGMMAIETMMSIFRADFRKGIDKANLEKGLYFDRGGGERCWCVGTGNCFNVGFEPKPPSAPVGVTLE